MIGYNFTHATRIALQRARERATALGHGAVAPEHILLGITDHPDKLALEVMRRCGVDIPAVASGALEAAKALSIPTLSSPDLPYTASAKRVLEVAMAESATLNHNYVGTEHLLLALLRQDAIKPLLAAVGLELPAARAALAELQPRMPPVAGDFMHTIAVPSQSRLALVIALLALLVAFVALIVAATR